MSRARLEWAAPPAVDPNEVAEYFAKKASRVPIVHGVWAEVLDMRLHLITVVDGDLDAELPLHQVEVDVMRRWPNVPVKFRSYQKGGWIPEELTPDKAIYARSG